MTYIKYLVLLWCAIVACIQPLNAQDTPEELGKFVFHAIRQDSLGKVDQLIPTVEEMKKIAAQLGVSKDSEQYKEMLVGREAQIAELHENLDLVYSDTLDTGLKWKTAKLEKVRAVMDSIQVDTKDPSSKRALVAKVSIYFTNGADRFVITLNDVFPVGELWKMGSSIYMKTIK